MAYGAPMADRDLMVLSPPVVSAFFRRGIVTAFGGGEPSSMRAHATSIMALRRAPLSSARLIGLSGSILALRSRERAKFWGTGTPVRCSATYAHSGGVKPRIERMIRMQSGVELARSMIWSRGSLEKLTVTFFRASQSSAA